MQVTGGIILYLLVVAVAHVGQFYICDSTTPDTDSDPDGTFSTVLAYATFSTCGETDNPALSIVLFTLFTLPIFLMLATAVLMLAQTSITGAFILLGVFLVALLAIFGL